MRITRTLEECPPESLRGCVCYYGGSDYRWQVGRGRDVHDDCEGETDTKRKAMDEVERRVFC